MMKNEMYLIPETKVINLRLNSVLMTSISATGQDVDFFTESDFESMFTE